MMTGRTGAGAKTRAEVGRPQVWLLTGDKVGDNAQIQAIADALGWPYDCKRLHFTGVNRFHHRLFGPSLRNVDLSRSDPLRPPWPDLVLTIGRRQIPVALWIREQSGGRTKLVQVGQTRAALEKFDLVVATPLYRLPPRPNVLSLTLPLMRRSTGTVAAAAAAWEPRLAGLRRPLTALFVGGPASPFALDRQIAQELIAAVSAFVARDGGALIATTSRRTPGAVADALEAGMPPDGFFYRWAPDSQENPYLACLDLADRFIVTGDSVSMLVEVVNLGKPVAIYPLPIEMFPGQRLRSWLKDMLSPPRTFEGGAAVWRQGLADWLNRLGLLSYARDLPAFHRRLIDQGLAVPFGDPIVGSGSVPDELDRAVARIEELMHAARPIECGRAESQDFLA